MRASSLVPLASLALVAAIVASGVTPWLVVAGMPIAFVTLDQTFGRVRRNPSPPVAAWRWPLWLFVPAQIAFLALCIVFSAHLDVGGIVALSIAAGMTLGIFGMLTAHELVHSRHRAERTLGTIALGSVFYAHFRVAHVQGHHRFAGRSDDPTEVRRDDSAYRFAVRSTARQAMFAYRVRRFPIFVAVAAYLTVLALDGWAAGWRGVLCHIAVAVTAIFILETFNYVVHYGLARRRMGDTLEPFGAAHSWNVAHRFSNWALLNGGLHAAHHATPLRNHAALRLDEEAPALPGGFGIAMCLALAPPLWRRVMNPRVDALMAR